jgi:hypothetical protein
VPEPKSVKNRVHVDVDPAPGVPVDERRPAVRAHADLLQAHGARMLRELDEPTGWALVMQDPEGNEFCLH